MKILFVSSANSIEGISTIVYNQYLSLKKEGLNINYFGIKGKGIINYLKAIFLLRKYVSQEKVDLIHAHYSFSGFVAGISSRVPVVTSLMGSDIYKPFSLRFFIRIFYTFRWNRVIVKSKRMKVDSKLKNSIVIPNGVDFEVFRPIGKRIALNFTNWSNNKVNILFAADPTRSEKYFEIFNQAMSYLVDFEFEIHYLKNIANVDVPFFYNSADVVVLTSKYEGSPNVIKEALACNRPIVCTDVGDVKENILGIDGCYICDQNPEDIARKIILALKFRFVNSREKILHLSNDKIAEKIFNLYKSII